jgi:phosphoribosylaminoimidazolecarboxamide formyltransferase/IMP cyclohydrolase
MTYQSDQADGIHRKDNAARSVKMEQRIQRVLISVTDKKGIIDFAKKLETFGVEILSTGGTAAQLKDQGITVTDVSDYTGFPEMMDGRLKTLHPKVHGGILALRDKDEHMKALDAHGIGLIDMVVINLYPFEDTVAREGCTLEEAVENIDIGGPTMLRAAAKNHRFVTVVTDPGDYEAVIDEMKRTGGAISEETNFALAVKTFQLTARYDGAISNYLGTLLPGGTKNFPATFTMQFVKAQELRYGENPHQKAAFYRERGVSIPSISTARQIQGKELSYNNIMDSDAAWLMASDFNLPVAVIMKHANPCGSATSDSSLVNAYLKALETDPVSAFGGIVAFNRPVDKRTAEELANIFLEVVIAPGFDDDALQILETKKNLRLLEIPIPLRQGAPIDYDYRRVAGGLLIQERDRTDEDIRKADVVTTRAPSDNEYQALAFAWHVVKHVKSNAIVLATKDQLVGVGAGQMSRVDSVSIATMKANLPTHGTVLASDAFFPFRDGVDMAAEAGVTAIIQPGGSIRDDEAIKAANEHGIAMIFTGKRHFRH